MIDRHIIAHAGLSATYVLMFVLLVLDGHLAHGACALAAAACYALLCLRPAAHPAAPPEDVTERN